jgi:hypothetical protein
MPHIVDEWNVGPEDDIATSFRLRLVSTVDLCDSNGQPLGGSYYLERQPAGSLRLERWEPIANFPWMFGHVAHRLAQKEDV